MGKSTPSSFAHSWILFESKFFYSNSNLSKDLDVIRHLYQIMQKLLLTRDEQQKVKNQSLLYQSSEGIFGMKMTIMNRKLIFPGLFINN